MIGRRKMEVDSIEGRKTVCSNMIGSQRKESVDKTFLERLLLGTS
jgi:hypothetical protein